MVTGTVGGGASPSHAPSLGPHHQEYQTAPPVQFYVPAGLPQPDLGHEVNGQSLPMGPLSVDQPIKIHDHSLRLSDKIVEPIRYRHSSPALLDEYDVAFPPLVTQDVGEREEVSDEVVSVLDSILEHVDLKLDGEAEKAKQKEQVAKVAEPKPIPVDNVWSRKASEKKAPANVRQAPVKPPAPPAKKQVLHHTVKKVKAGHGQSCGTGHQAGGHGHGQSKAANRGETREKTPRKKQQDRNRRSNASQSFLRESRPQPESTPKAVVRKNLSESDCDDELQSIVSDNDTVTDYYHQPPPQIYTQNQARYPPNHPQPQGLSQFPPNHPRNPHAAQASQAISDSFMLPPGRHYRVYGPPSEGMGHPVLLLDSGCGSSPTGDELSSPEPVSTPDDVPGDSG